MPRMPRGRYPSAVDRAVPYRPRDTSRAICSSAPREQQGRSRKSGRARWRVLRRHRWWSFEPAVIAEEPEPWILNRADKRSPIKETVELLAGSFRDQSAAMTRGKIAGIRALSRCAADLHAH